MIYIALKSEFSFRKCFYHLSDLVNDAVERGDKSVGIADVNNTYSHVPFRKLCKAAGIKPIFGVRLTGTEEHVKSKSYRETYDSICEFIFIAKNDVGLVELYKLVNTAYDQFYYFPRLTYEQVVDVSENLIVLCPRFPMAMGMFHKFGLKQRCDYIYNDNPSDKSVDVLETVAVPHVIYPKQDDFGVYDILSSYSGSDTRTYGGYIKSEEDLLIDGFSERSLEITDEIADQCFADIEQAEMAHFTGSETIDNACKKGAMRLGVDIFSPGEYKDRYDHEIGLIKEKNFGDYFLIVSDMLLKAKETSLVGPGRGSSGGSLVCYLMGITSIDPIKYELLFERFIDVNRIGLPDIDTDIPDIKRQDVIKYLSKKYGEDNVRSIAIISTFQPKVAIGDFAKALGVPTYDTDDVKDSIIERSTGDARAAMCILDTLEGTDAGVHFMEKYPEMRIVHRIEGHARHSGKHAAGVIVANKPLYNFGGVDSRESTTMMDGKQAESIGLLKIDILGLRTLSILEETARLGGFDFKNFYTLDLNDDLVFKIFNENRLYGIFQFEGKALGIVTKQMGVESFDDICAITSLGRPGALNSGQTGKFIKRRTGQEEPVYYGDAYKRFTKSTYGNVIYQEQTMYILREVGNLSWLDTNALRAAMSKSYGDEYFARYKDKFLAGAKELGHNEEDAKAIWISVSSMGSYGFNKSHAVAYSMISYWTAWCKAYYPLEFAAANLNNAKDDQTAVKILRDFVVNDGVEYVPVDPDKSDIKWTIKDGKLVGGLMNLPGIGVKKAQEIIRKRESGEPFTPSIVRKLMKPETVFDILFPTEHYWGALYRNHDKYGLDDRPGKIVDANDPGVYTIIGLVTERDLRDRNDVQSVIKRGGTKVETDQYYLNLYIEDDTDSIKCSIPPFKFDELDGKYWSENAIPGKTWLLIKGRIRDNWRSISISAIADLDTSIGRLTGIK